MDGSVGFATKTILSKNHPNRLLLNAHQLANTQMIEQTDTLHPQARSGSLRFSLSFPALA
jgi:hypothetical protein